MSEITLKIMLHFARERGEDSCGIATRTKLCKEAKDPRDFIKYRLPTDKIVLGHARGMSAYVGGKSKENAHPFKHAGLVGIHNGKIRNWRKIKREEKLEYKVDSQVIWYLFHKYGYAETFDKITGTMALAWIDEEDNLNLYRHENPLYIGYKDEGLYFGSQKHYLKAIDCVDIKQIEEHHRLVISDGAIIKDHDLSDHIPQYRYTNNYRKGGQNTQEQGGDNVRSYPRGKGTPTTADFILDCNSDLGYYYWFSSSDPNLLYIKPSSPLMEHEPSLEIFHIHNANDVKKLINNFSDVYSLKSIKHKIPAELQ